MYWGHKSDTLISIPIHFTHTTNWQRSRVQHLCTFFFEFENTMHTKVLHKVGQIVDAKQQNCGKKLVTLLAILL